MAPWNWYGSPAVSFGTENTYSTATAMNITIPNSDDDSLPELTLDELNYLMRLAKKDRKLTGILTKLLDDVTVILPL